MAQGEASCSSFCQASWLARNNRSRGGEGCWALVPTVALMEVMVGACPHAACPGAAVPARVPAQHLLSLHSEAAFRRAVLHCGCASWLQNPFLEPYGKTELCQTVWPVLFVFLFFFFSLCSCCKLEEDSSAAVLQACFRGRVCGAGAAWLPCSVCEGFLCVTPSVPCQHKPAAWTPGPGMLASFSHLGWVALVLLTLSLLRYMGIWMCLLILTLPKA